MPDFIDLLPLISEDIEDIRARLDADANAGIDPSDARYTDTTAGGFYFDLTQAPALEIERLWDYLSTEVPAAMLLPYAFGGYLDAWGEAFDVPRKDETAAVGEVTFTGTDGTLIATGTQVAVPQTDPDADPVVFQSTQAASVTGGTAAAAVEAVDAGAEGNVAAGAISLVLSPLEGITGVTNAAATLGGTDVETDEAYRARLLLEFRGAQGSGTVADYQRWALAWPGVGFATVEPIWNGAGTVRVVITDPGNDPVSAQTVADLQADLDPVPGEGRGTAPIGHTVTVATPTSLVVDVGATVVHEDGYSLDGASGTVATRDAIEEALAAYIDRLPPGEDVLLNRTESQFFGVDGVYNVSGVTLNAVAADVAVGPLQVPSIGTVTLA